jgi:hypothetical protein
MLSFVAPVDSASFSSYAAESHYVLNLGQRNIIAWVDNVQWSGDPRRIDPTTASLWCDKFNNTSNVLVCETKSEYVWVCQ